MSDRRDDMLDFLDGAMPEDRQAELRAWLDQDAARWEQLAELSFLHSAIGETLRNEQSATELRLDTFKGSDASQTASVIAELARLEAAATPELVNLDKRQKAEAEAASQSPRYITGHEVAFAVGYLIRHAVTPKRVAYAAAAAVLVIAATVLIVMQGVGNPGPGQSPATVQSPGSEGTPTQHVATLTATHNAKWAEGASAPESNLTPGDTLTANQRLTLTAGFAQITTNKGTIAIIEAPAIIEFTESDNAIRLHTGKLVGICETPSSKGFLVRTPHMDITDLGTRFGVDATQTNATEVHVFKGEVRVARPATSTDPSASKILVEGQAVRAMASAQGFVDRPTESDRFPKDMSVRWLAGTGRSQRAGEADRNWRVVAVDGQAVTEHSEMIVVPNHHDGSSDPNTSQWLLINEALNPPGKSSAVFTCRSSFQVPDTIDPDQTKLVIRCSADFLVKAVRINGQALSVPNNRIGVGDPWFTLPLADHFTPGENTIEIDVYEVFYAPGKANSSSLRVEVQAHRR